MRKHQWLRTTLSRAYYCSFSSSFPLKHVTQSNFESAVANLKTHLKAADFVAIDLEMTGVASAPWRESLEFDRFDVKYLKVKDSAEKFAVVQFGVCPFRWDPLRLSFIAHPHNFYIFPRQEVPTDSSSCEFLCQTTSMDFLAKYHFDFNACIRQGVSYLSRWQEDEALRRLNLRYEDELSEQARDVPLFSITDILFSERMKNRLREWRDGLLKDTSGGSQFEGSFLNDSNQQFQNIFYKMRPALSLNGFTSHQLRLIQSVTKKHFKDLAFVRVEGESSCSQQLVVYTDSESDRDLLKKEVMDDYRRQAEMKIKAAIGFRHVIDLLSSEKKLIIGHNCFLDLAHVHSKFLGPLPLEAEEFVHSVNKCFPYIIDTKILLNANNILKQRMNKSKTSLSSAFLSLCPQIAFASNESCNLTFSSSVKVEGIDFKLYSPSENLACNERLQKHANLLYLSWINGDIIDLSTGHRTAESLRCRDLKKWQTGILFENIVLIWGFPSDLKTAVIKDRISKVFGPTSVTSICRLDETAVFVQFSKSKLVADFLLVKETLDRSNDAFSVLHPLSTILEGGNTCAASYETYKDICSSPLSKVLFADQAQAVGIRWKTKLVERKEEIEIEEQDNFREENAANTISVYVEQN
ncbi:POLY(A)-SPECIFIC RIBONUCLEASE PNLDC1 [Salix purpurea]|uniref:POLY(A)-SPECIFIC RIBONUCLEASE PNLDC1 n=1 Tax=Salix purpurea TaxID=77065 RepID=A0A9Q0VSP5_SALPP|nr:POLY(A)-SPECIFIC RIBONUCLEASE PNLDC1 [Salix purpurea]